MKTIIKVENLSKQYRLGNVGTGTISHDLNRAWHRMRGKEDPYLKIGEENNRTEKGKSEYVWALKDINFEVNQGEVLGIIGRNGAGKSTLLKILSRTTTPTTGSVKIKGRVASLLEVGTGFHPELTGRENIFLNGAILGMTKQEIKSKFDEIVDFAGVERYIDTPVKRYSSGMYVRLAFGVAAHLEPETLIVDEVLAVGDAEFQEKALGKMRDVSYKEGRTVLFVSHNIDAIKKLCQSAILLKHGKIALKDSVDTCIKIYSNEKQLSTKLVKEINNYQLSEHVSICNFSLDKLEYYPDEISKISLSISSTLSNSFESIVLLIYNESDTRVAICDLRPYGIRDFSKDKKNILIDVIINGFRLVEGVYKLGLFLQSKIIENNFLDLLKFKLKSGLNSEIQYPVTVQGYSVIDFQTKLSG